ncbi:MAG: Hsp20 family protein [Bacteroidetes bacterium]|nr:Hsp20 family protein [Bacteroidota bacterium]
MALIKSTPKRSGWNDVFMPTSFGQLMDDFFTENRMNQAARFSPKTDISEDEKGFHIELSLPGMKKEDVSLEVKKDMLTIEGERKFESEEKDKTYHRVESSYGSFKRSFTLPDYTNSDAIEATFENGILKVFVPKAEKIAAKSIEIK